MRIRYDNVPDPSRVRVGDLLLLPREDPENRKTRLSANSISKFGVSVGDTGRADNRYADVQHLIYNRCDIPLVLEVTSAQPGRVPGWSDAARRIRDNRNLLCNDDADGNVVGSVKLHYVNFTLDDRFYPINESRGEKPYEFFGCTRFKDAVSSVLGEIVGPQIVMCPDLNPCDKAAGVVLTRAGYSTPAIPCATSSGSARLVATDMEAQSLGPNKALSCIVDRYVSGFDKVLVAETSFLSAMVIRGAKLVRPSAGMSWKDAYVRRIADRILLRVKENELRVAKMLSDYAGRLLAGGRTSVDRSKLAVAAAKRLRILAGERRALDAFAEGK